MTILEKIKFEEDWLSEVNLTKENIKIAFAGIRATVLEQQPCEDCISREDAIKEFQVYREYSSNRTHDDWVDRIELVLTDLPSVTPKTEWIPVSERLPKENEYIGNVCKYYLIQDEYRDMHVAHLSNVGWIPMESLKTIGDEIIAWQELPEPYKAESGDKE